MVFFPSQVEATDRSSPEQLGLAFRGESGLLVSAITALTRLIPLHHFSAMEPQPTTTHLSHWGGGVDSWCVSWGKFKCPP